MPTIQVMTAIAERLEPVFGSLRGQVWDPEEVVLCDVGVDGACTAIRERFRLPR